MSEMLLWEPTRPVHRVCPLLGSVARFTTEALEEGLAEFKPCCLVVQPPVTLLFCASVSL